MSSKGPEVGEALISPLRLEQGQWRKVRGEVGEQHGD